MVAAATMSLPERAREGRNYDYRYAWIRDQCMAGQAVAQLGPYPAARRRRRIRARLPARAWSRSPSRLHDDRRPGARRGELDLPGYPGGTALLGNRVNKQFQLDIFGESLLLFSEAARHDRLDADGWRAVEAAAEAIAARWTEPDAGIWELDPDNWTHSRLACVAGLRAISARAPRRPEDGGLAGPGRRDRRGDIGTGIASERTLAALTGRRAPGRVAAAPGDPRRHPGGRPRTLATLRRVHRRVDGGRICVPLQAATPARSENPKAPSCSAASCCRSRWAQQGDFTAATHWFERNRAGCRPPGSARRGVRRHAAPATRQRASGLRPRPAPRMRSRTPLRL